MRGRGHERCREVGAAFSVFRFCRGCFSGGPAGARRRSAKSPAPSYRRAPPGEAIPDTVPADSELGIPLGSFRLFPTLDVRVGYDTNAFASQATADGSAYEAIRPSLEVRSDWNNHMLNFGAYGAFGFYNSATSLNYQNFGFNTDGRLDIYRDWYLTASAAFTGTTEAFGTPDVAQAQAPSVVYAVPLSLGMYQRFNRLFYQASASATGLRYSDYSQLNTNALPAGSRDRNLFGESLRAGYELREGFDVWVQGALNQRRYLQYVNIAGQQRDSDGWSVTGGSTLDLGGVSKLEGFVGYSQQNYFSAGVNTGAVIFGLGGTWNGYQPLVVRPVRRSIHQRDGVHQLSGLCVDDLRRRVHLHNP